jgi:hypothetical protein
MRSKLLAIPFLLAVGCAGPMDSEGTDDGSPEATSGPASEEVAETQQALVADPNLIPLVTFYSAARGDYFTTSDPAWTCGAFGTCSVGSGYRFIGIAGYVHRPVLVESVERRQLSHLRPGLAGSRRGRHLRA